MNSKFVLPTSSEFDIHLFFPTSACSNLNLVNYYHPTTIVNTLHLQTSSLLS